MIQRSYENSNYGKLYLIPTPIGNLDDITLRSLNVLKEVDLVYAEDTRESYNLLKYYNISKKIDSCHKYSEMKHKDKIVKLLKDGKNIAYMTDRGTPLISDPGNVIVDECINNNISVISLPGPNALLPALNMSGLNNDKFLFYGFLSNKKTQAKKELIKLKEITYTMVFYESPFRLLDTLKLMLDTFGDRKIAIVREISKLYEEINRDSLSNIINNFNGIKGEIVIVVEGNKSNTNAFNVDLDKELYELIKKGYSKRDAVKELSVKYNINKNQIYNKYKEE